MTPKVWLITGCSSGFGRELVNHALAQGDKVIATARNAAKIDNLKDVGADVMMLDVTASLDELKKAAQEAFELYGQIDYLINNAGYAQTGSLEELTPEETYAQFSTNVFGLLNVTRAVLPYLRKAHSGVIANLSSVGAWNGFAGCGLYCATKAAVTVLSESMTLELAEFGIKVCSVEPGYFRSNFLNPGNVIDHSQIINEYQRTESASRKGIEMLREYNMKQPGDVKKAAKAMFEVLSAEDVPARLVLGSDGYAAIRQRCLDVVKTLDEWKDVSTATDIVE